MVPDADTSTVLGWLRERGVERGDDVGLAIGAPAGLGLATAGDTLAEMLVSDESGLRLTMGSEPSSGNRAIRGGRPEGIYYRRPTTRMGVVWEARKAFYDAQAYMQQKTDPNADPEMIAKLYSAIESAMGIENVTITP